MTGGLPAPGPPAGPGRPPGALPAGTSVPHSARIWNYWLGGTDNYPVDRAAGDRYREAYPEIVAVALAVRQFLARAVRTLVTEAGVRQFLDVGAGLPAADNTHQVAQRAAADCRVVYADNDPLVLAQARALLAGTAEGSCDYLDADLRDPAAILRQAGRTIDLARPVALLLLGVLGHIAGYSEARSAVAELLAGLAPGSYLVLGDSIDAGEGHKRAGRDYASTGAIAYHLRSRGQIEGYFDGLELLSPGVVPVSQWRPGPGSPPAAPLLSLGGVARKP